MYNGSHSDGTLSSYGSYYNGRVANTLEATETIILTEYNHSVCPKNWRLPNKAQTVAITNYASQFNIINPGYGKSRQIEQAGVTGYWWGCTASSSSSFWHIGATGSAFNNNTNNGVYHGLSVRCLQVNN